MRNRARSAEPVAGCLEVLAFVEEDRDGPLRRPDLQHRRRVGPAAILNPRRSTSSRPRWLSRGTPRSQSAAQSDRAARRPVARGSRTSPRCARRKLGLELGPHRGEEPGGGVPRGLVERRGREAFDLPEVEVALDRRLVAGRPETATFHASPDRSRRSGGAGWGRCRAAPSNTSAHRPRGDVHPSWRSRRRAGAWRRYRSTRRSARFALEQPDGRLQAPRPSRLWRKVTDWRGCRRWSPNQPTWIFPVEPRVSSK